MPTPGIHQIQTHIIKWMKQILQKVCNLQDPGKNKGIGLHAVVRTCPTNKIYVGNIRLTIILLPYCLVCFLRIRGLG